MNGFMWNTLEPVENRIATLEAFAVGLTKYYSQLLQDCRPAGLPGWKFADHEIERLVVILSYLYENQNGYYLQQRNTARRARVNEETQASRYIVDMDVDPKKPGSFAPLWATIGAVNQVDQHIGCSPRSVKLVAKKHIFLILPDRDASVGMKSGKAVRIFPCSLNSHDSLRRWHAGEKVAENAVALSWTPSSGKTRATKGRVKVEAKAIEEDDWVPGSNLRPFQCAPVTDCDPRINRNGSSVMNISIDPSVLEEHLRSDKSRVEAQEAEQVLLHVIQARPFHVMLSSIPSRGSGSSGAERGETDVSARSQKRTRDLRSARQKVKKKDGTHSNTGSYHRGQLVRPSVVYDSVFDLTLEHDEAPDVSRIDPAPSTASVAALLELEEARRALSVALDKELESQRKIKLLQKQLESGREAQEVKQLRRELSRTKEKLEKVEAEAREKIRTLQRELALELEAKDEALKQTEVLEEKLERKQASQEEALDNMKSLRKELKKKTERLRALQQQQEMMGMVDDKRVVSLEQELQTENQNVMRSLRRELERKEVMMKNLRDQLEKVKGSMGALRAEKEEARNASRQAVLRLEGELAEAEAKVKEFKEEQAYIQWWLW
ncbi:conserved hypothetical protein [Perkinsus marinus ATCC 50983]|uniref:Uncharacterized protein n=1 Tax=Perkinsus marinus (strain ATCC 50983 / TXsc) TaxID=423536 RepID=C5LYW1_PERM5|nr:conserved hypothetical protein [Perkinsus marinus ATCC 50983]EEQ98135.1 conserved hypothetical protein [Perkinsus marinus ATCC 50983]|eukprot:XP_002765418.1 conserved hypothetical protein [Perkinsus marinus ATCC 50983]